MCGRFTREFTWRQVHEFLSLPLAWLEAGPAGFAASWNVAPTQQSLVARAGREEAGGGVGGREAVMMEWGLRPAWVDKPGLAPINARSETVASSPMFRRAFKERRCIVPVSGFYEWKKVGERKQAWYVRLRDEPIMGMAGLWEARKLEGAAGGAIASPTWALTFTILTTRANAFMVGIHDRMPVVLGAERFEEWLGNAEVDPRTLGPIRAERMQGWAVSTRVNSPRNDDRRLVEPVEEVGEAKGLFG